MKSLLISAALMLVQIPLPAFAGGSFSEAPVPESMGVEQVSPGASLSVPSIGAQTDLGNEAIDASLTEGLGSDLPISNAGRSITAMSAPDSALSAAGAAASKTPALQHAQDAREAAAEVSNAPMTGEQTPPAAAAYGEGEPLKTALSGDAASSRDFSRPSRATPFKALGQLRNLADKISDAWNGAFGSRVFNYGSGGSSNSGGGSLGIGNGSSGNSGDAKLPKLGKTPARYDIRTLKLAKYIKAGVPAAPEQVDFSKPVTDWGMMLNDKIGDCTIACSGHEIQQWTANAGEEQTPTDKQILKAYEDVSGYNPKDPNSDAGANPIDVLNYRRATGIGGHTIAAYAAVNLKDLNEVKWAMDKFGSLYIGVALPVSAQNQSTWDVPPGGAVGDGAPGSWGGHAINGTAYDGQLLSIVTWGGITPMTWNFFQTYVDEAYVAITQDFLDTEGKTPNNGLDLDALQADLKAVTADNIGNTLNKAINKAVNWVRKIRAANARS